MKTVLLAMPISVRNATNEFAQRRTLFLWQRRHDQFAISYAELDRRSASDPRFSGEMPWNPNRQTITPLLNRRFHVSTMSIRRGLMLQPFSPVRFFIRHGWLQHRAQKRRGAAEAISRHLLRCADGDNLSA